MKEIKLENFLEMYKLKDVGIKNAQKYNLEFPIHVNENIAKLIAYLTFDGHLSLRQRCFLFTGKSIEILKDFSYTVKKEFNLTGKVRRQGFSGRFKGTSYEYRVFSSPITKVLYLLGSPSGNKVLISFDVPTWIKSSRKFSRIYLRVAFDCEGSIWKEKTGRIRIGFKMSKSLEILNDGIKFMNSIREMLLKFKIKTTKISILKGNIRKDGIITKEMVFKIRDKDVNLFCKEIGFCNKIKIRKFKEYLGLTDDVGHSAQSRRLAWSINKAKRIRAFISAQWVFARKSLRPGFKSQRPHLRT